MPRVPVAIIGCGIGGASLATLLAHAGIECAVFEKEKRVQPRFRGEILQPYGVHILDTLGLIDQIHSRGASRVTGFHSSFTCETGSPQARVRIAQRGNLPDYAVTCRHQDLFSALRAPLREHPRIQLYEGRRVEKLNRSSTDQWEIQTQTRQGTLEHFRVPIVVGADGAKSLLHRQQDLGPKEAQLENFLLGLVIESTVTQAENFVSVFEQGRYTYFFPLGNSQARLGIEISGDDLHPGKHDLERELLAGGLQALEKIGYPIGNYKVTEPLQVVPTYRVRQQRAARDGLFMLGDALGTVDPITGHGMTLACHDAVQLGVSLLPYFRSRRQPEDLEQATTAYNRAQGYRRTIEELSDRMVSAFLRSGSARDRRALITVLGGNVDPAVPVNDPSLRHARRLASNSADFTARQSPALLTQVIKAQTIPPLAPPGSIDKRRLFLSIGSTGLRLKTSLDWETHYRQQNPSRMPWFYRRLDPDLADALTARSINSGVILDLGTGVGTQAVALAERGFRVIATDVSRSAIKRARNLAQKRGLTVDFLVDDILQTRLKSGINHIFDRGCFHGLGRNQRSQYVEAVSKLIDVGGFLFLKCLSTREKRNLPPSRFEPEDIATRFEKTFQIVSIDHTTYQGTLDPAPQALFCVLQRNGNDG